MHNDFEYGYMIYQKDEDAFAEVIRRYERLVQKKSIKCANVFESIGATYDEARQECLISLYESIFSYKEYLGVGLARYIEVCMDTRLLGYIRTLTKKSNVLSGTRYSLDYYVSEDNAYYECTKDPSFRIDPEQMSYYYEAKELMDKVLNTMMSVEKEVYELRKIGYSYKEISEMFNLTEKDVDNKVQKVRRAIRKAYDYYYAGLEPNDFVKMTR